MKSNARLYATAHMARRVTKSAPADDVMPSISPDGMRISGGRFANLTAGHLDFLRRALRVGLDVEAIRNGLQSRQATPPQPVQNATYTPAAPSAGFTPEELAGIVSQASGQVINPAQVIRAIHVFSRPTWWRKKILASLERVEGRWKITVRGVNNKTQNAYAYLMEIELSSVKVLDRATGQTRETTVLRFKKW